MKAKMQPKATCPGVSGAMKTRIPVSMRRLAHSTTCTHTTHRKNGIPGMKKRNVGHKAWKGQFSMYGNVGGSSKEQIRNMLPM